MKIVSWFIDAELDNGKSLKISEIPDYVARLVDEWLSELEAD